MKQLLKKAESITILILMLSLIGCENDDNNLPKVIAGFTYTLNADTGTVTFINTSENAGSYTWDFGDGGTSNEINPLKTYANGSYTVTLKASNASGASASFEDTIIINIPNPITLPVTFDNPNVAYNVATFGGASFEILDNPDVSGTNDQASKVGAITNSGAAFEGINFDLGTQLDLSSNKTITMNFWADAPVAVLIKLEQGTGDDIEVTASHGGTGWEVISFDFNSSNKYVRVTLFVDGPGTTAGTFYIDDIIQIQTPPAACTPETIQSLAVADFNLTFQTDPGASIGSFDAVLTTVANPDPDNAVNTSCKAGQIDRNGGALFANNQIEFDEKLDFNANAGFKMKVWSPEAGTNVLVKLEDKTNSAINVEVGATTTSAGAWEELSFDFGSAEGGKYDRIIVFFELNTNTTETYYIDDFRLYERAGGGGGTAATFPLNFEDGILFFNAFEGAATAIIDNPQPTGNPSSKVLELVKPSGVPFYAGINSSQNLNGPLIDLSNGMAFKIKVWSPKAGILVRMRLEQEEGVIQPPAYEVFQTIATANQWVTLTFDFTDQAMSSYTYTRLVLNADWDTDGGGESYYFDDVEQVAGGDSGGGTTPTAAAPVPTQDAANVISIYSDVYTAIAGIDLNPDWGQATVVSEVPIAGDNTQLYTGLNFQGINFDANPQDVSGKEFLHLDFWSVNSTALNIFLISPGPAETAYALTVPTTGWSSVDIPLSAFSGVDLANLIQLKFEGNGDIYLDNIYFYGSGGSTTCTDTTLVLPIDFDCEGIDYTSKIVGNVSFSVIDNPELSGINNVASKVGSIVNVGANWENAFFNLDTPIDFSANNTIKFKFYSTVSVALKLKMEDGTAGPVEVDVNHGGTGWEELSFTFTTTELYNDMVLFVDGPGTTAGTFYIDDIEQVAGGGGGATGELAENGDFETGNLDGWAVITNGGIIIADNTENNGGNWSGKIVASPTGLNPTLKQERKGAGAIAVGDIVQIKFDYKGSAAAGGIYDIRSFVEATNGVNQTEIFSVTPTDTWQTFTTTYTIGAGDISGGITLQFGAICGGVTGCSSTLSLDNVSVILNP